MDRDLQKEAPNVVTELEFHQLLRMGYKGEIICEADAYFKAAVWYGEWSVRISNSDGTFRKTLATYPRTAGQDPHVRFKMFKTINATASFMHRMGFKEFTIPFFEGGETVHILPAEDRDTSDSNGTSDS